MTPSVTHGSCTLGGKHRDPDMAAVCPVLRRDSRQALRAPRRPYKAGRMAKSGKRA
jgi:hypothetical protein